MFARTPFCLLLLFFLSGCAQNDRPEGSSFDPLDLLDNPQPKHVRFIQVRINSTVVEPLPEGYGFESFYWPPGIDFRYDHLANPPNKTLASNYADTLWTVEDHDTVILGTHNIVSNRHRIEQQVFAVAPERESPFAYIAGIGFHFVPRGNATMLSYFGPYTIGTFTIALNYPGHPVPIPAQFDREARFPLFDANYQHNFTEVQARVVSNITMTYWGEATFVQDAESLEQLRNDPDRFLWEYNRHPSQHTKDGREGMRTASCGSLILKTYDPCMDPWMRPA